jgi:type II secretory pathway pseudopilin PulG
MHTPLAIRIVRWGFCVIVVAAIVAGLSISGSPADRRRATLDERRVNSLNQISSAIDSYVQTKGIIPPTLDALVQDQPYLATELRDPTTGTLYEYLPADASTSTYQLCATFDLPTQTDEAPSITVPVKDTWGNPTINPHGAGRSCYLFHVRGRFAPMDVPPVPQKLPNAI